MPLVRRRNLLSDIGAGDQAAPVDQTSLDPGGGAGDPMPVGTDAMSEGDLGALAGSGADVGAADDAAVQELQAALDDPSTPPDERAMLQARLALAARRKLAGLGSDAGAGGGM